MPVVPASVANFEQGDLPSSPPSVTLPKPSGVASGDYLLCVVTVNFDHSGNPDTQWSMSDWTKLAVRNTPSGQYYPKVAIFGRVATGSEPSSYTLTRTVGGGNLVAAILRFTGVDPADPIANAPSLVSGPQSSGSFGNHTPAAPGYSLWVYCNHNYRSGKDTNVNWSGGAGSEVTEVVNVFCFQSIFGNEAVQGQSAGTRSISVQNWGGNTPSTCTPLVLREGSVAEPIERNIEPVDIVPLPLAPTTRRTVVGRPQPVDLAVDVPAPTAEVTQNVWADVPPVDVTTIAYGLDGEKVSPVPVVDLGHTHPAPDLARRAQVVPVDVEHQHPQVTELVGNVAAPTDIVVTTVLPLDLAHQAQLPSGPQVQITPIDPQIERVVDVPQVTVNAEPRPPLVYSTDFRPVPVQVDVMPVTVAYSTDTTAAQRGIPIRVFTHPARVLAQNIRTHEWIHLDLPVNNLEITRALSGAQSITGEFPAEVGELADLDLEPWATWIHVEQGDTIRASGILQPTRVDQGQRLALEAVGVSAYPHGIPYLGPDFKGIEVDPADCLRLIWQHLQSFDDGDLGVEVLGSTPVRIGEEERDVSFETEEGEQVEFTAGPYKLLWYEGTDCGSEQDSLAKECPFEFTEVEYWNDSALKDYVRHEIRIHYPRAGQRRDDIVFAQDENMATTFGPEEDPETYASHVVLLGKGEGTTTVRGAAGATHPTRLRRVALVDDKTVSSGSRANALAIEEWYRRQATRDITEITVRAHHDNAPIGSYHEGDDAKVVGDVPHWGWLNQYERILGYTWSPDQELVRLQLRRSESFNYGAGEAPTG